MLISGTPTLCRGQDEESQLTSGAVIAFPAGRAGIHQIVDRSPHAARVLICATNQVPEAAEQPESATLAVSQLTCTHGRQ